MVVSDKSNSATLKTFEKQAMAVQDKLDKRKKQSGDATAKVAKKTADEEIREARRAGKEAERILGRHERIVARAHAQEIRSGQKKAAEMLRLMDRETAAKERALAKETRDAERKSQRIIRERQKELDASLRATDREAAARQRAYSKMIRDGERLISQQQRLRAAQSGVMGGWKDALLGIAGGYFTIHKAIRSVIQAIEDKDKLLKKTKEATESIFEAQAGALMMIEGVDAQKAAAFKARINKMATELRVTGGAKTLYQAAQEGLSAAIGGDVEMALPAIEAAARVAPHDPEAIKALTMGLIHVGKATKSGDPMADLGFLVGLTQAAAVPDISKVAEVFSGAVASMTQYGGTAVESGAALSAISQVAVDVSGRISRIAGIRWFEQMESFFRTQGLITPETDTPAEQIQWFRAHPEAASLFIRGKAKTLEDEKAAAEAAGADPEMVNEFAMRAQAQMAIEQILGVPGRSTTGYDYYAKYLDTLKEGPEAVKFAEGLEASMASTFESRVARQTRERETRRESLMTRTSAGMKRAAGDPFAWEEITEDLQAAGVGFWTRGLLRQARRGRLFRGWGREESYTKLMMEAADIQEYRGDPEGAKQLRASMAETLDLSAGQQTRANYELQIERATAEAGGGADVVSSVDEVEKAIREEAERSRQAAEQQTEAITSAIAGRPLTAPTPPAASPARDIRRRSPGVLPLPRVGY